MPLKTEHIVEIKKLIQETIRETFADESFISNLAQKVGDKVSAAEIKQEAAEQKIEIVALKKRVDWLEGKISVYERNSKMNNVRIYGIKEDPGRKIEETVLSILNDKMGLNLNVEQIEYCYLFGKTLEDGSRTALLRLINSRTRETVLRNKGKLKGSKIVIMEDLSQDKYKLLKSAIQMLGKKNIWTFRGNIFAKVNNQKYAIKTMGDITDIMHVEK